MGRHLGSLNRREGERDEDYKLRCDNARLAIKGAKGKPARAKKSKRSPKEATNHPMEKAAEKAKEVEVSIHRLSSLEHEQILKEIHASLKDNEGSTDKEMYNKFLLICRPPSNPKLNIADLYCISSQQDTSKEESSGNSPVRLPFIESKDPRNRPSSTFSRMFTGTSENANQSKLSM